jgi:hypothetical protein
MFTILFKDMHIREIYLPPIIHLLGSSRSIYTRNRINFEFDLPVEYVMLDLSIDVYSGESMLPVLFISGSSQIITVSLMAGSHCFMISIFFTSLPGNRRS